MKTIEGIKTEIEKLRTETVNPGERGEKKARLAYNKVVAHIEFLYGCQLYLESNPREDFIRSEVERLEDSLVRIDNNFETWMLNNRPPVKNEDDEKMYLKAYRTEMQVSEIAKRIKHLKFLLT